MVRNMNIVQINDPAIRFSLMTLKFIFITIICFMTLSSMASSKLVLYSFQEIVAKSDAIGPVTTKLPKWPTFVDLLQIHQ